MPLINITEMGSSLSQMNTSLDFYGVILNDWTNGWWGFVIWLVLYIVIYTSLMRYGSTDAFVSTSIVMSILTTIAVAIGLIPQLWMWVSFLISGLALAAYYYQKY